MSKPTGVFFCPSCQSLVQSDGPLKRGIICEECGYEFGKPIPVVKKVGGIPAGSDPLQQAQEKSSGVSRNIMAKRSTADGVGLDLEKIALPMKAREEVIEEETEARRSDEETIMPDGSRRVKRRKKRLKKENHKNLILVMVGSLLVAILAVSLFKSRDNGESGNEDQATKEELNDRTVKREVLKRFYPVVVSNFSEFLSYPTNDGREQFISNSAELSLPFTRHYRQHAFPTPESKIKPVAQNVIKLSESDYGIETVWEDENANRIGAVYLWDGEAWKIDWENFSRYSTDLWQRFRTETGSKEGTFRLLVRKQETSDETEEFNLSFYRPPSMLEARDDFRVTDDTEVSLETQSALGQEFLALWNDFKDGKVPCDSILGASLDPDNCMRISVVLAWEENESNESVMVLKDIVGVAWFGQVIQGLYEKGSQRGEIEKDPVLTN